MTEAEARAALRAFVGVGDVPTKGTGFGFMAVIGGAPVLWRPAPRSWRLKDQRARSATDECRRSSVSN